MKQLLIAFGAGILFALGLGISGMTMPSKVIGFLDFSGSWDPSLSFVMVGAIAVHFVFYRFVLHMRSPLFHSNFFLPKASQLDSRLILGSALFGIGWGLAGYCPGPALTSVVTMTKPTLVFIGSMMAGMILEHVLLRRTTPSPTLTSKAVSEAQ
jgi:uncharacterized protein